ncbi:MAG: acylphosphatase [Gemmatimonadota bacterium]
MTIRFHVTGRVQGVGFRWFVVKEARALGLAGYVRNLVDGSVEVLADGEAADLERLAAALAHGPEAARVAGVAREASVVPVEPGRFEVRHGGAHDE